MPTLTPVEGDPFSSAVKTTPVDHDPFAAPKWKSDPGGFLKTQLGVPVTVNSTFRTPEHNAAVGGVSGSAHTKGEAIDFSPQGMSTAQAADKLAEQLLEAGVPFDQIINEGNHVHVSFDPKARGQVMGALAAAPEVTKTTAVDYDPFAKKPEADKPPLKAKPAGMKMPDFVRQFTEDWNERTASAKDQLKQGATVGGGGGPLESLASMANLAGGALSYVAAPELAAIDTLAGRGVEMASKGALPKTFVGDTALNVGAFLIPGAEGAGGKAHVPEAVTAEHIAKRAPHAPEVVKTTPVDHDPFTKAAEPTHEERWIAAQEKEDAEEIFARGPAADPSAPVGSPDHAGPVVGDEAEAATRVDNAIYRLGGHSTADKLEAMDFLKGVPPELADPAVQEELYHEIEQQIVDPNHQIPEHLKPAYEAYRPWREEQLARVNRLRERGDPNIEPFLPETGHVARRVKGHTPLFDAAYDPQGEVHDPILGRRGLGKNASALKKRTAGFVVEDADGKTYFTQDVGEDHTDAVGRPLAKVRQATSREIEENTDIRYYKNPLINTVDDVLRLRRVERNLQVLDEITKGLKEEGLAHHDEWHYKNTDGQWVRMRSNTETPPGFVKLSHIPQLEGWSFDPHVADTLKDYYPAEDVPLDNILGKINRGLIGSLFITPIPHALNVWGHWVVGRGWDWIMPQGYARLMKTGTEAMQQVIGRGEKYRQLLREGNGLLYGSTQVRNFHQLMLEKAGMELIDSPETWKQLAKSFKLDINSMGDFLRLFYRASNKAMWLANDIFMMQRVLELEKKGMDVREAIVDAEKDIPNYRIPSRVLGSRSAAQLIKSRNYLMFGRYKYGQYKAWGSMFHDLIGPNATGEERLEAAGKFMVAAVIAMGAYPIADAALQKLTKNKDARVRRAGPFAITDAVLQFTTGQKDFATALSSMISPSPGITAGLEIAHNRDFFGRKIVEDQSTPMGKVVQGAEYAASPLYPIGLAAEATKPGGAAQAAGKLVGLDIPPEGTKDRRESFKGRERQAAIKREARDNLQQTIQSVIDKVTGKGGGTTPPAELAEPDLPGHVPVPVDYDPFAVQGR